MTRQTKHDAMHGAIAIDTSMSALSYHSVYISQYTNDTHA